MEGRINPSNKLKFVESKIKLKLNQPVTLPHQKLITVANNHDLILIACEDCSIKFFRTDQLLDFTSRKSQVVPENATDIISLASRPTLLTVARSGYSSVVLIAGITPFLQVYDLDSKTTIGRLDLNDMRGSEIVDYAWHPNFFDSIVALTSNHGHLLVMAINRDAKKIELVYRNDGWGALTCCWSPKGKNLAVGTMGGSVFRLEPVSGFSDLKEVDRSTITFSNPKVTPEHQVKKLRWVNKNYLIVVHSRPNNPDTVLSLITVKPSKPYLYWTNIFFENQDTSNYIVHLAAFTAGVICSSSATGEAAVIGISEAPNMDGNEMNDWSMLMIEEEGARIELPLDASNRETHPCGLTTTFWSDDRIPVLIFYTNDGLVCSYAAMHFEKIFKLPFDTPKQVVPLDQAPSCAFDIDEEMRQVRGKHDFNEAYVTLFDDLNHLRDRFDGILDLHKSHREALDTFQEDIDKVDLQIIETLYLIEYIKSRPTKKRSVDPVTLNKVTNLKLALKNIETKLEELNNHVDVAWEDFVRRKSNKQRCSLDIIYQTLATNQKIINVLKTKIEIEPEVSVVAKPNVKPRDEDHSKFVEFLSSRSVVPVRKPI